MPARGPFVVRLFTPDDEVAVNVREEPKFSRSWRGGFKDAEIRLAEPINSRSPLLAPFSKIRIDDARTGRTVSETYMALPGKSRTRDGGDVWDVSGVGPQARLFDRQRAWIGIDTTFDGWKFRGRSNGNMSADTAADPNDEDIDALIFTWPDGMAIAAGNPTTGPRTSMRYDRLQQTGQFIGGLSFTHREGRADANMKTELNVSTAGVGGSFETARSRVWDTALDTTSAAAGGAFDLGQAGKNLALLRIIRSAGVATNVASDNWWSATRAIRISALRRAQDGTWIYSTDYNNDYLLAHEVVIDALYWFCAQGVGSDWFSAIDIVNAQIDTSFTHHIDQLAYMDPTTFGAVLEDLALLEPDMGWEVLESNSVGQHRFKLHRVLDGSTRSGSAQSGARYLIPPNAYVDYNQPGGEADMRNAATIAWEDGTGKKRSKQYLSADLGIDVPGLDQWSILRDTDLIELGNELGSVANADRIGPKLLEQASKPPASATVTVIGQVIDMWTGKMAHPWEIETGYPAAVQDVDMDPLPITDHDHSDGTAQLTLSEPVLTDEQLVNAYARRRRRRA